MADRFWRGGTAAWDGTAGAKWADTAGGATGAAVPTSADDVFFDATSSGTCTISTGNTGAKSINCTGFTGTIAGSAAITVSGSLTFVAGMAVTYTGGITFAATATITSAGKTISGAGGGITVDGTGITVSLADALNVGTGRVNVNRGTFTTNDYNITAGDTVNNIAFSVTMNLGSSTITLSSTTPILFTGGANFTLNAGTSTFVLTSGSALVSGGVTFYNVSFTDTTVGTRRVEGVNTFNNLTVTGPASAGVVQVTFAASQTINGTLSTTGTAGNRRVWFRGVTYGIAQTLTVNATPSLTDADFRDIYVIGTAAPISGTRVGDARGCRGITFDTPKTVYWVTAAGGNWSANAWAASSGAGASTDNFPLAQDTAVIENTGLNTSATVTLDALIAYFGTIDMSTRTNAMTLAGSTAYTVYGDWKFGSGVTRSYTGGLTFSGRNTQTITSAGKAFAQAFTIDTYGGSVELADALNTGGGGFTVTNGTFDTKNYNVTTAQFFSSNTSVRTIVFGSSVLTTSNPTAIDFSTSTNLTFNAGTSTINHGHAGNPVFNGGGMTFYNLNFTDNNQATCSITGGNTFNNITVTAPVSTGFRQLSLAANQTITGTLTVAGASPIRRIFVRSDTLGTTRTLTVGTLSATDCDFRDITIAGTAAGSSPTRAGDCGGNSGITFPAPKTVYWNLAGAQNWSATAWAPGSGGVPDINNFPLAQDTAVFDEAVNSVTGTITINLAWNIGTFDASARTSAMTLTTSTNSPFIYGDWKFGTGVTSSSTTGAITFAGRGTQTITSNGVTFGCPVTIDCITGTVQLADAINLGAARILTLTSGTFDAVSYNVTTHFFGSTNATTRTLKMGSGTWTLTGTATLWDCALTTNLNFYKGTANIVLSDTSTTARTFAGGALSYNKLTIGGATGTSTLTISGNNQFTELASTKTVAHTIALGTTTQTFGKWTVTGTVGNVVTLTGTGTSHILAGACTDSIDYLAIGSIRFAATSPGEFYAGVNSTATGSPAAPTYLTAKPADSTRYWVGGTGNWSDTARWSTGSGGGSGASVPRSHDDVVFDSASNATAYTATVDAVTGGIRMKALTIAGPLVGNLTLAGSTAMVGIHGNVTLPATGLTRTYTGNITFTGSTSGKTLTTNGVTLAATITINGVGCEWALGSALNTTTADIIITNGLFDTASYNVTAGGCISNHGNSVTYILGSSTIDFGGSGTTINFGTTETNAANLTFTANTSQINFTNNNPGLTGNGKTFYNVAFTSASAGTVTINGANSFNNLSFTGITSANLKNISITANQTISGTLTLSAGTNATMRHFVRSDTIGTTRTLTCAAVSLTDVDFRDITIAGVAAPATGTRIGDGKGNSGITFTAAANKYWNLAGNNNWSAIGWALSSGASPSVNNFPLAQDTCIFESTSPGTGATTTINAAYNIGTIDMSARTTNTMTLAIGTTAPAIYGNWINGTGTTLTGTGTMTFAGRGSQTITSAGKTFTQTFTINTPGGSVTLQDALTLSQSVSIVLTLTNGTFDASSYNVSLSGAAGGFASSNFNTRTIAIGSGTWSIGGTSTWTITGSPTITGTGTISLTSGSTKTFLGGGLAYTNITLNQGGAGTLTITGNNTFNDITNTYKATGATNITLGTTTQRVSQWTAAGEAGRVLTVQGTSASSPATLVYTGSGTAANVDYLTITGVRAYDLTTTWYAGANSTNNGSLGWYFDSGVVAISASFEDTATGSDQFSATVSFAASFQDTVTASDQISSLAVFLTAVSDTSTASDSITSNFLYVSNFSDSAVASDSISATPTYSQFISESTTASDVISTTGVFGATVNETVTTIDSASASVVFVSAFQDISTSSDQFLGGLLIISVVTESSTITDSIASLVTFASSFTDTASGTDSTLVAASTFNAPFSDSATITDANVGLVTFSTAIDESATGSDSDVGFLILPTTISESATGTDTTSSAQTFAVTIQDQASGADQTLVAPSVFNAPFQDSVQTIDVFRSNTIFSVSIAEQIAMTDILIGGYLWTPVDDSQGAVWTDVNNSQGASWTPVIP
jgi:hypothetical protein